jgi:hypothetical protein
MNLKKILILPLGFILIHALYIGCCKCIEGNFHREISSLRAIEYSHSGFSTKDTINVTDTLFATIQFNYNLIGKNSTNPMAQLINTAYATRCNCGNYSDSGYKYKIDSLVITSSDNFKGVPPGKDISSFFKATQSIFFGSGSTNFITIPQLIDSMNAKKYYDNIDLFTDPGTMTIKIQHLKYMVYSNGKSYEATGTKVIAWQ